MSLKKLKLSMDVTPLIELRLGFIDKESAKRIRDGEDFNEVIEEITDGDGVYGVESLMPGTDLLPSDRFEEIKDNIRCEFDGKAIPVNVFKIGVHEDWDAEWEEQADQLTANERAAFENDRDAILQDRRKDQEAIDEALASILTFPKIVWTSAMEFEEASYSMDTELETDDQPRVSVVFYTKYAPQPWHDELVDDAGDVFESRFLSELDSPMYLGGIYVNGESVPFELNTDEPNAEETIITVYRRAGGLVKYSS